MMVAGREQQASAKNSTRGLLGSTLLIPEYIITNILLRGRTNQKILPLVFLKILSENELKVQPSQVSLHFGLAKSRRRLARLLGTNRCLSLIGQKLFLIALVEERVVRTFVIRDDSVQVAIFSLKFLVVTATLQ